MGYLDDLYLNVYALPVVDTSWDPIDWLTYETNSLSTSSTPTSPRAIRFNGDGTKAFIVDEFSSTIYQWDLSVAWDISSASYSFVSADVSSEDNELQDICWNSDGSRLYIVGKGIDGEGYINTFACSPAYDISALVSAENAGFQYENTLSYGAEGIQVSADESKIFCLSANAGTGNTVVREITVVTPGDVTTASVTDTLDITSKLTAGRGIVVGQDGEKLWVSGLSDVIYQWTMSTAWDLTGITDDNLSGSVNSEATQSRGFGVREDDGSQLYMTDVSGAVYQYNFVEPAGWVAGNDLTTPAGGTAVFDFFPHGTGSNLNAYDDTGAEVSGSQIGTLPTGTDGDGFAYVGDFDGSSYLHWLYPGAASNDACANDKVCIYVVFDHAGTGTDGYVGLGSGVNNATGERIWGTYNQFGSVSMSRYDNGAVTVSDGGGNGGADKEVLAIFSQHDGVGGAVVGAADSGEAMTTSTNGSATGDVAFTRVWICSTQMPSISGGWTGKIYRVIVVEGADYDATYATSVLASCQP